MLWGGYDRQRTLAIRIAAITLASDSARTTARFRPSKPAKILADLGLFKKADSSRSDGCLRVLVKFMSV